MVLICKSTPRTFYRCHHDLINMNICVTDNYEHLPVQHIIHDFDIIELESPLSVLPVEEQMTWRRGYEYCKSLGRRLVYVSPSVRADFQYMYEDINCGCNITFWTAHQVSNHTVVKAQRYYDNFPLDNIKEDSSLLLCVFPLCTSVNKIIGWEADECNDSSARHGLVCDIVFPEGSYVSCD
ncbi:unnamed protein product [Mytilus edulis]|uniref:Uncharacterized protein n=1 Tax=Mytilus edulis TaxID=6550 RepID=A0A8S3QPJ7_MYTED|nr:unnamed protein product [Mytilus edulis]